MREFINLVQLLFERFDPDQFLNRMGGVMELVRRGGTEGERAAAREAFGRMMQRAKDEIARMRQPDSGVTRAEIDRFMSRLDRLRTEPRQEPPKQKKPEAPKVARYRVGQWIVWHFDRDDSLAQYVSKIIKIVQSGDDFFYLMSDPTTTVPEFRILRPATQDEVDAAMASRTKTTTGATDSDIEILAFARFVDPDANSNKVYGVLRHNGKIYTFWGGFHKALKVKLYPDRETAAAQLRAKVRKGYELGDHSRHEAWLMRALKAELAARY